MKKKQQLGPLQEEWLRCLESGEFKQTKGLLCGNPDSKGVCRNCCLGVACVVAEVNDVGIDATWSTLTGVWSWDTNSGFLPPKVIQAMGFNNRRGGLTIEFDGYLSLAAANDGGVTFAEIAAFVRKHPEAVFTGPA